MISNPYVPEKMKIIDVIPQTDIDFTYRIESGIRPENGQFVQVSLPKVGEAPISISDFGEGYIELTIRKVGRVTNVIHDLKKGDYFLIRGPYGKGFPLDIYKGKHLIIAAGGTGLAPVKSIINYFNRNPYEVKRFDIIMGFKSPDDILFKDEIDSWSKSFNTLLTVDKADESWNGNTGLITGYVPGFEIEDYSNVEVVVVGPPAMMKFTTLEFLKKGIPKEKMWVSFERNMSCAIGKCGHCKIDETYVCLEGPVFNYTKAKKLLD